MKPTPEVTNFCNTVAGDFFEPTNPLHITDNFFLHIEHSRSLRERYNDLITGHGEGVINPQIGRWVKERYNLENIVEIDRPKSSLIKTYTLHCR